MTQETALNILKSGANVFLTGEPGSGKTHTINRYVLYLRERGLEPAVTASTGIAATHLGGMTIHSWSGLGIKTSLHKYDLDKIATTEYLSKRIGRAKVLIIDEVSMLTPGMLSMVDAVCREIKRNIEPFGGLQVIFVGDFFQLPPIVRASPMLRPASQTSLLETPQARFAYDSPAWARAKPLVCYLSEQYRQDDSVFLDLLSAIRHNIFADNHLQHLSARKTEPHLAPEDAPKLYSHNVDVDRVNNEKLNKLPNKMREFISAAQGSRALAAILQKGCLSPERLCLKTGAAVMFTKNNSREGFVNGTLGTVVGFSKHTGYPVVKTRMGQQIEAAPMDWTVEENGQVRASITQLPLRLAWAITVHKSQGMSLDEAVMDLSAVFEYGQGYVALSRLRRLSGLHLLGWNERAFQVHPEVLAKDESFRLDSVAVETTFTQITPAELQKMQKNFIEACGGIENLNASRPKKKKRKRRPEPWNQGW